MGPKVPQPEDERVLTHHPDEVEAAREGGSREIILATTTSTRDSGLLDELLRGEGFEVTRRVVPDERDAIAEAIPLTGTGRNRKKALLIFYGIVTFFIILFCSDC